MFGVGIGELFVVFIVAVLVLGPKELPHAVRKAGVFYAKSRQWLAQLNAKAEAELQLEDLQKRIDLAATKSDVSDLLKKPPEQS
jgi:sec-independent protein translocase protein TatB